MSEPLDLRAVEARLKAATPGPWGLYGDPNNPEPSQGAFEAAPGLSVGSVHNTEPIARVSGYMHPLKANAELILNAPTDLEALLTALRTTRTALLDIQHEFEQHLSDHRSIGRAWKRVAAVLAQVSDG